MRMEKTFAEQAYAAGPIDIVWDGTNDKGNKIRPGAYLMTMVATDGVHVSSKTISLVVGNANRGGARGRIR